MIQSVIDLEALSGPLAGDNPCGEDLRYTSVYEEIKEARREDEVIDQGAWQTDLKKADWDKVIKLTTAALKGRTKDLQIAVWLTEALIKKHGFAGLASGLGVMGTFIADFWDTIYPLPDEGDLEYRIGPLEFLNEKLSSVVRKVPITDPKASSGFSWYQWQESRQGAGEGKITAEEFSAAAAKSSKEFYAKLSTDLDTCVEIFQRLDAVIDEKFGGDAPGLGEMQKSIDECRDVVNGIFKAKGGRPASSGGDQVSGEATPPDAAHGEESSAEISGSSAAGASQGAVVFVPAGGISDQGDYERAVWKDAQETLKGSGVRPALEKLLNASCSAPSMRQKNRYRLMMAKLALKASRPDISRPILEELYALITTLNLEQWESPLWLAEVIEAYYQCLTADGASDDDIAKAHGELYPKLCSKDITKALQYTKGG